MRRADGRSASQAVNLALRAARATHDRAFPCADPRLWESRVISGLRGMWQVHSGTCLTCPTSELVGSHRQYIVTEITGLRPRLEITEKQRRGLCKGEQQLFHHRNLETPVPCAGSLGPTQNLPRGPATGFSGLGEAHGVAGQEHGLWGQKELNPSCAAPLCDLTQAS